MVIGIPYSGAFSKGGFGSCVTAKCCKQKQGSGSQGGGCTSLGF
jgi:hypothetical protein